MFDKGAPLIRFRGFGYHTKFDLQRIIIKNAQSTFFFLSEFKSYIKCLKSTLRRMTFSSIWQNLFDKCLIDKTK